MAVLKGSWKPNQMATATVHTVNQQTPHTGSHTYEELRLERVDYLGAYRIPLETGLLVQSGYVNLPVWPHGL